MASLNSDGSFSYHDVVTKIIKAMCSVGRLSFHFQCHSRLTKLYSYYLRKYIMISMVYANTFKYNIYVPFQSYDALL